MKTHFSNKSKSTSYGSLTRVAAVAAIIAGMLLAVAPGANAVLVKRYLGIKINAGNHDFGSGAHVGGAPVGGGLVDFDYTPNEDGILIATATVLGTVYWDSSDPGCARAIVSFLDENQTVLASAGVNACGFTGGNANDDANQSEVNVSFGSSNLAFVKISVHQLGVGFPPPLIGGVTNTLAAPMSAFVQTTINNGNTDFGTSFHLGGTPLAPGVVGFNRDNGLMRGSVDGRLYWDSLFSGGCARLVVHYQTANGDVTLATNTFNDCGPGGDANASANNSVVHSSFVPDHGRLGRIRLRVGTVDPGGSFVNVESRTFAFQNAVGGFDVTPETSVVTPLERTNLGFTWEIPPPLNWHDLETLQLRIRDEEGTVLWVLFEEASNSFSLWNEGTKQFEGGVAAGSSRRLQTPEATLYLAESSVRGSGPTGPSVRLNLSLSFKPLAAGRTYAVEVAATDDLGNEDDFVQAGTVTVTDR